MRITIFGLCVTSSWGNGHATLWRGLIRALVKRNCQVSFFERDAPYYAAHRDLAEIAGAEIVLYSEWGDVLRHARERIRDCDAAIVTSYCPDALPATGLVMDCCRGMSVFYDLDTPVTLSRLEEGEAVPYIGPRGLRDFDLVLSFTGGRALDLLHTTLGARKAVPLYGHVDPDVHRKAAPRSGYCGELSYIGTYADDRQALLQSLFLDVARRQPESRFVIAGSLYPQDFPWRRNIHFVRHLAPAEHAAFFASCRLTLNITRASMRRHGWCPSGRIFEAAACQAPLITDDWEGLGAFYAPGRELIVARTTDDVVAALGLGDGELARMAEAARARTLAAHTSGHRADTLLHTLASARATEPRQSALRVGE